MKQQRINGLDFARFFAFAGMVIVNFQVVMLSTKQHDFDLLTHALAFLEGKAAATFVILAGMGVAFAYQRNRSEHFGASMLKRAAFLLAIGLLNLIIFSADIIHYYAFYFALGIWLLPLKKRTLLGITAFIILAFPLLMMALNYDAGWNWETLTYTGFWTPTGFARNLFFNGWHPIIPWLAFFSFGIFLSKIDLTNRTIATRMAIIGATGMIIVPLFSQSLIHALIPILGTEATAIFATSPVPPGPLYMLNGISTALLVLGICLLLPEPFYKRTIVEALSKTGQLTLTLYFAHIVIGMGIIDAFGLVGTSSSTAAFWAAIGFVASSVIFTHFWSKKFKRGPIEELMRRVTK